MDANSGVELCRVTVIAPRTRMDLALPTDSPLADLLPTLLRYAGESPDDPAFLRGGWILQRLGENALDPAQRLASLGVKDGDVLYLRRRESSLPEFAFDDVSDAISTAGRTRRAAWDDSHTRTASMVVAGTGFAVGGFIALMSGPPWILPTVIMLSVSVVLLGIGAALSRAFNEARAGALVGGFAVAYAAIGGFLLLGRSQPLTEFGAAHLTVGLVLAMVMATIVAFAVVAGWDGFFGVAAVAGLGTLGALSVLLEVGPSSGRYVYGAPEAAAIVLTIALASAPMLPTICARLAKLPMPVIPTNAEDLRKQTDVLPGPTVLQQAVTADKLIAAFLAGSAVIGVGCSVFLLQDEGGWYAPALVASTALALLLRARHFRGRTQRLWLISGGTLCAMLLVAGMAVTDRGESSLLLMVGLPSLLAACLVAAWGIWMPGRVLSPYWGRYADLFEVVVLLTVVPFAIGVLGLYGTIWDRLSG